MDRKYPGLYKSSTSGLVTTWDLYISDDCLSSDVLHTIEHTLRSYLKSLYSNFRIVGVHVKGSQTGVYILTRGFNKDTLTDELLSYIDSLCLLFEITSNMQSNCDSPELHNLLEAKKILKEYSFNLVMSSL